MAKRRTEKLMRMREFSEASGVSKGTIKFYIREGLIPRPIKTHPNSAHYNDTHLNAILSVKELRSKRFLPLSVIREILGQGKDQLSIEEVRTLTLMDGRLFHNLSEQPTIKPLTLKQLQARTGVNLKDIKALEEHRILNPIEKGKRKYYEEDDIRVVEGWAKLRKAGVTDDFGFGPSNLIIYRDMVERLVVDEARLLATHMTGKVPLEELVKMIEETRLFATILFDVLHKKKVLEMFRRVSEQFQSSLTDGLLEGGLEPEGLGSKGKRPKKDL